MSLECRPTHRRGGRDVTSASRSDDCASIERGGRKGRAGVTTVKTAIVTCSRKDGVTYLRHSQMCKDYVDGMLSQVTGEEVLT